MKNYWRPKYKIGQIIYAFIDSEDKIIKAQITGINDNWTYTINREYIVFECNITKNIKRMIKRILGKEYVYNKVIDEYLKSHYKEELTK